MKPIEILKLLLACIGSAVAAAIMPIVTVVALSVWIAEERLYASPPRAPIIPGAALAVAALVALRGLL